jgi:hypothetical protein
MIITENAQRDKKGMVTNPKNSMNFVVHDTPSEQGERVSGIIL